MRDYEQLDHSTGETEKKIEAALEDGSWTLLIDPACRVAVDPDGAQTAAIFDAMHAQRNANDPEVNHG